MIVADTSGLLAFFNRREPKHRPVVDVVESADQQLVVSPFVLAELDYLVQKRLGVGAEVALLTELASGAYWLPSVGVQDLAACTAVVEQYRDLGIGLADASLVVLAARYETDRILTLDRRHFLALRSAGGRPFGCSRRSVWGARTPSRVRPPG